jgi:hypothetical protein
MEQNFIPISITIGIGIVISFWIKGILEKNDYKVNPFTGYFRDTKNIFNLSAATKDNLKRKYFFMLGLLNILSMVAVLILFIFFVAASIREVDAAPCNSYKDFKSYTYDYVVINKYIDSSEHSYPTLILQNKDGYRFKDLDFIFDKSNFFYFLNIGDSIKKKKGEDMIRVINSKIDTVLKVDFGCDEK